MTPQEESYDCSNGREQLLDEKALFGLFCLTFPNTFGAVHILWSSKDTYMRMLSAGAAPYCIILIDRFGVLSMRGWVPQS